MWYLDGFTVAEGVCVGVLFGVFVKFISLACIHSRRGEKKLKRHVPTRRDAMHATEGFCVEVEEIEK